MASCLWFDHVKLIMQIRVGHAMLKMAYSGKIVGIEALFATKRRRCIGHSAQYLIARSSDPRSEGRHLGASW